MTSPSVSAQYPFEMPISSSRPPHSGRRTLSQQKVNGSLKATSASSLGPLSPSSPSDGKKRVHWNKDVEDNEKAPGRSPKTKASNPASTSRKSSSPNISSSSSSLSSSSSSRPKRKSPLSSSKDDYSLRAPPPTPRIQRQPTPDLSDIECGDFCYCCPPRGQAKDAERKMNDQLDAAMAHIAAAKQRGR